MKPTWVKDDQIRRCPKCSHYMVALADFEYQGADDSALSDGNEVTNFMFWGLWSIAYSVAQSLFENIGISRGRGRVEKIKAEILPNYPESLICPACLNVLKAPGARP